MIESGSQGTMLGVQSTAGGIEPCTQSSITPSVDHHPVYRCRCHLSFHRHCCRHCWQPPHGHLQLPVLFRHCRLKAAARHLDNLHLTTELIELYGSALGVVAVTTASKEDLF